LLDSFSIIVANGFGLCIRAGWRDEVLSTRGERRCGLQNFKFATHPAWHTTCVII